MLKARRSGTIVVALAVATAALGAGVGRTAAEDPENVVDLDLGAVVATIESDVLAWTRMVPADLDLRAEVIEGSEGIVADAQLKSYTTLTPKLRDLRTKLATRRERLIFGTARGDAPPPKHDERAFAEIDVRSLLAVDSFAESAPILGLRGRKGLFLTSVVEDERYSRRAIEVDILKDLADRVLHDTGTDFGNLEVANGFILVRATSDGIARVRRLVDSLRAMTGTRIALDVREYRMPRALYSELSSASTGAGLSPEAEKLLAQGLDSGKVVLQGSRSLLTRDGRDVASFSGDLRTYVSSVESLRGDSASTARISTQLYTGDRLLLRPTLAPGGKTVSLDFTFGLAELSGPLAKATFLGSELELPELAFARADSSAEIPLGKTTLIAGTFTGETAGEKTPLARVVAVKPTIADDRATAPATPPVAKPDPRQAEPLASYSPAVKLELALLDTVLALLDTTVGRLGEVYRYGFFDVRNLIEGMDSRRGLPLGLFLPEPEVPQRVLKPIDEESDYMLNGPDRLEVIVKSLSGADEVWGDPASLEIHHGTLIIRQTAIVLARVEEILASLRRSRTRLIRFETGLYHLEPGVAEYLTSIALAGGEAPGVLSPVALAALDEATANGRATSLGGGFLVAQEGERSYVEQGRERACVAGFEPLPGVPAGLRPIVGIVRTGVNFEIHGEFDASAEEGRLALVARATHASERERRFAASAQGCVETPTLALEALNARGALRSGKALMVTTSNASATQGGVSAFVVRATAP